MKTLLYDLYTAQSSKDVKIHGGGEYIKKLFEYLVGTNSGSYRIITFYDKNKFMDERIIALIDSYNVEAFHVESISDIQRLIYDMKEQCDLFYSGLVSIYKEICFPDSIKKIATIHGLRELEISFDKYMSFYYPKRIYFKKMIGSLFYEYRINKKIEKINELIGEFDKIIVSSQHTRYAIETWLNNCSDIEMIVAYPPSTEKKINEEVPEFSHYALLISAGRYEKNVCRAIFAFDELFEKAKLGELKVVVCGCMPKRLKKKIKHADRIIEYGYVSDSFLQGLFKNCDFFLYPSVNEGFGYPPIEAMRYGKTCVVSAVCSLPEVCGDVVYYTNPYDIKEIENRILQAYGNKIDKNKILSHYCNLNKHQQEDLERIKEFILD